MPLKILVAILSLAAFALWFAWPNDVVVDSPVASIHAVVNQTAVEYGFSSAAPQDANVWIPPEITFDSYESQYGPLPASLEATQIPFGMMVDASGNLIIDGKLRRLFDYFFTLDGEEPLDTILGRIEELIRQYLPASVQARALAILEQYVNLKRAEIELAARIDADFRLSGQQPSPAHLKREIRDLRGSHLDPEVYEGFFGEEDRRDEYTLSRIEILQNPSLTDEERDQALQMIEQNLPDSDRAYFEEERKTREVSRLIDAARAEGASDAEIFHIRAQAFGPEAAERFAIADKEIDTWDARVAAYREQRRAILSADGYSDADKEAEIQFLREQHFEGTELKRIPVIDAMMDAEE